MQTILAVNASSAVRQLNQQLLAAGFRVRFVEIENANTFPFVEPPAAIIVRFQYESEPAQEICLEIRRAEPDMPIMIISPRRDPAIKICFLDLCADDYLEEPFASEELIARLRSIIRRTTRTNSAGV